MRWWRSSALERGCVAFVGTMPASPGSGPRARPSGALRADGPRSDRRSDPAGLGGGVGCRRALAWASLAVGANKPHTAPRVDPVAVCGLDPWLVCGLDPWLEVRRRRDGRGRLVRARPGQRWRTSELPSGRRRISMPIGSWRFIASTWVITPIIRPEPQLLECPTASSVHRVECRSPRRRTAPRTPCRWAGRRRLRARPPSGPRHRG